MLAAEIQHFLRFLDAADEGAREGAAAHDQAEDVDLKRFVGRADHGEGTVDLQQVEIGVHVVRGGDGVQDEIEAVGVFGHVGFVFRDDRSGRAEALGIRRLAGGGRDHPGFRAHGAGQLYAHMAEAAEANDSDLHALFHPPVAQGGIGRDARAEEGGRAREVEVIGHAQDKILIDRDFLGIAAVGGGFSVLLHAVIGAGKAVIAILLKALRAVRAFAAGIDEAAYAYSVADLEFLDVRADFFDVADDLMPRDHREDRAAPFVARLMDVGVAHAAEGDVDENVVRPRLSALQRMGAEGACGALRGVGFDVDHRGLRFSSGELGCACSLRNWGKIIKFVFS